MTKEEMVNVYVKWSIGIEFFYAYPDNKSGFIYGGKIQHEKLNEVVTVETESPQNGGSKKLRILVGKAKKAVESPEIICTIAELKETLAYLRRNGTRYNEGDAFEYIMYKKAGKENLWKKDCKHFYKGGDLGNIQIKYNKASVVNESLLTKLENGYI
jgi:hypothetical protein